MSSTQGLFSFFSKPPYGMSVAHAQTLSRDGRSIVSKKTRSYDFYPMSESYDETFSVGCKVWVYVGAHIKTWLPGIVTGEIPPRYFNNIEVYPRSYTITVLPSKIAIHMSHACLTTHLNKINNAPEEAVYAPQYGDVKPHCGRSLMLLILEGFYTMEELRFLCRGFNRALIQMGFDLRKLNFCSEPDVKSLIAQGVNTMFSSMDLGVDGSTAPSIKTARDEYNSFEMALKKMRIDNDEDILMDCVIMA